MVRKATRKNAITSAKSVNSKALWQTYRNLQNQADAAFDKFRKDVKKHARPDIILNDHHQLLLLLGQCNYMTQECMRMASRKRRKAA